MPVGVMVGEEEIASNIVRIKRLGLGTKNEGDQVPRGEMIERVKDVLSELHL